MSRLHDVAQRWRPKTRRGRREFWKHQPYVDEIAANCQGAQWRHLGKDHVHACATAALELAEKHHASTVYYSEVETCDLRQVVLEVCGAQTWTVIQDFRDAESSDAEVAVLVRKADGIVTDGRVVQLVAATQEGHEKTGAGIRARSAAFASVRWTGKGWHDHLGAGHADPKRAARARATYLRRFLAGKGVRVGDLNVIRRALLRILHGTASIAGAGVLWFVSLSESHLQLLGTFDIGSDHTAVLVRRYKPTTKGHHA